jgi:hypothetical protein
MTPTTPPSPTPPGPTGPASRTTAVFVDGVEAETGRARLLLGDDAFTVPAALLPDGAREGSWLTLTATLAPAQADPDTLRRKLGAGDPGGPIEL